VRNIAEVTTAVAKGDLSRKITVDAKGEILELKNTINTMVDQLSAFADEVTRVAREVGTEGKLGGQARVPGVSGTWKDLTDNVNSMAPQPHQPGAQHRRGDHRGGQRATCRARSPSTPRARSSSSRPPSTPWSTSSTPSPTRSPASPARSAPRASSAARPRSPACPGTWKDLTDNVNSMAANLTDQVRNIATVVTAVANGDLSQKITVEAKGEILELARHHQPHGRDSCRSSPTRSPRVAREVGTEGQLGGQANVPGVPAPGRTSPTTSTSSPATSPPRCARSPRSPPR
jgi:HAMP domain-containing protein